MDGFVTDMLEEMAEHARPGTYDEPDKAKPTAASKRQKKGKKDYIPGVGTANYAFLIALFQVQ